MQSKQNCIEMFLFYKPIRVLADYEDLLSQKRLYYVSPM